MKPVLEIRVGDTPLVALDRLFPPQVVPVFAKLEMLNVGGSVKDRTAHYMVAQALAAGRLTAQSHLVESSSGNLAIALAMIAQRVGIPFTAVVDPNIAPANRRLIEAYGARVDMVREKDEGGGYLHTRVRRVAELSRTIPGAVWLNQYANPDNWRAHYHGIGASCVCQPVRSDPRKLLLRQPKFGHRLLLHPEGITGTPDKPNSWVPSPASKGGGERC